MMAAVTAPAPTLQTGQHVNVRNVHIGTLPATIDKADGAAVTVALAVNDDRVARLVGQEMAVELSSGRGIHRFGGTLSSQSGGGTLTIALNGDVERIQRREFVRVSASLDVTVRGIDESIGGETTTLDVSVNGIAVSDKWRLPIGLDVRVELALPDGPAAARARPRRAPGRRGASQGHPAGQPRAPGGGSPHAVHPRP